MSNGKTTSIARVQAQAVAKQDDWQGFNDEELRLLREGICAEATENEFSLFIKKCAHLKLSPFARQIYAVPRWNSKLRREEIVDQVSIDGMRLVAERTGAYRGQTPPQWCGPDRVWHEIWVAKNPPTGARCGVLRAGYEAPVYGVARYDSYVQTTKEGNPNATWRKMPDVMLHKCAEALALRKAFPNELSGTYTEDEMGQANNDAPARDERPGPRVVEAQFDGPSHALTELLGRIEAAKTLRELQDTWPATQKLNAAERERAVEAGKRRAAALAEAPPPADKPLPVDLARRAITAAKTPAEFAKATDLAHALPADERETIMDLWRSKQRELDAATATPLDTEDSGPAWEAARQAAVEARMAAEVEGE